MPFVAIPNPFNQFVPNTTRWSVSNALAMARCSDLAYQGAPIIDETPLGWGFSKFQVLPVVNDIQAVVMQNQHVVVIAFRGTVVPRDQSTDQPDLSNWMTDINCLLAPFTTYFGGAEIGQVHKGFAEALFGVWVSLAQLVDQYLDNGQTLWITGHSLGGALAVLATAAFTFVKRAPVSGLYTYGQPRVGDLTFCTMCDSHFGAQHFRFVNDQDIVTRVPPPVYLHFPGSEYYGHSGKVLYFDSQHVLHSDEYCWNAFLVSFPVGMQGLQNMFLRTAPDEFFNS